MKKNIEDANEKQMNYRWLNCILWYYNIYTKHLSISVMNIYCIFFIMKNELY